MAPKYAIATGKEECDVCKHMMKAKRSATQVDFAAGGEAAGGEAAIPVGVPKGYVGVFSCCCCWWWHCAPVELRLFDSFFFFLVSSCFFLFLFFF